MHTRFEGDHRDLPRPRIALANSSSRGSKPASQGVGDLGELGVTATPAEWLALVHMNGAFGAVQPYLIARG